VKMTRGTDVYTTKLVIGVDPRAKFTVEDRKLQLAALDRMYTLLRDMTYQVDRINGVRDALAQRAAQSGSDEALRKRLTDLSSKADNVRKEIVATKEGGHITGEERIREKAADVYGDLLDYEGRPGDYLVARIDSLTRELDDVAKEFDTFTAKDLQEANQALSKKKLQPVQPLTREAWDKANSGV